MLVRRLRAAIPISSQGERAKGPLDGWVDGLSAPRDDDGKQEQRDHTMFYLAEPRS
jgi:hypothetical protein